MGYGYLTVSTVIIQYLYAKYGRRSSGAIMKPQ